MKNVFAAILATLAISSSALAAELIVSLPGRDALAISVPSGWDATVNRPRDDLPPTIVIVAKSPGAFQMLITPVWPIGAAKAPTLSEIQSLVQGAATHAKPQAVEPALPLQPLSGTEATGYYFSATDRSPEPDGYKYLAQGALMLKELQITFTILVNGEPSVPTKQALEMLKTIHRVAPKNAT